MAWYCLSGLHLHMALTMYIPVHNLTMHSHLYILVHNLTMHSQCTYLTMHSHGALLQLNNALTMYIPVYILTMHSHGAQLNNAPYYTCTYMGTSVVLVNCNFNFSMAFKILATN